MTHISKRYAEANNEYMKDFDKTKPSTFIQYLDANSLYAWAMTQKRPTHGFKWIDVDKNIILKLLKKKDTKQGYIFEVDLDYPKTLWKSHNDYPLAPEKVRINKTEKLISSFLPKKNYVLHYKNLKQYLEEGMILKQVHRGIKFYQSPWMKPYIKTNIDFRKKAENDFERDFFKLMNNIVFGKTIENIRKRQNVKLVDDRKKALKLTSKPNFDRAAIFDESLVAIHMKKTEVYFNKPIFVGQAILDLSKTHMFDFHYNYIRNKYENKAELLFTDTDSLMYLIQTDDFYHDIEKDVKKNLIHLIMWLIILHHHHNHHHHHHGGLSRASRLRFQSLRSFMHAGSSAEVVAPTSSCRMFKKVVGGLPGFRLPWVGSHNTSWLAGSSLCR